MTIAAGVPRENTRWIDWYGNLEATPPFTDRQGRRFPFGRLIVGKQLLTMHPDVMKFLERPKACSGRRSLSTPRGWRSGTSTKS